jgi:hypothetical protein
VLKRHLDRVIALFIVSGFIGWRIAHDLLKKQHMGLDGFLNYETIYFDKYVRDFSHPVAHGFGYAIFIAVPILIYELIALALRSLQKFRQTN